MSCEQIAPNGYTCLDRDWSVLGGAVGAVVLVTVVIGLVLMRVEMVDDIRKRLCCVRDRDRQEPPSALSRPLWDILTRRRSSERADSDADGFAYGGNDPFKPLSPMSVFVREMTDDELYWLALVQWLKWRWAWDGLRALGELLLMIKFVEEYGAVKWSSLGSDIPWWAALLPFFVLDVVALVPLLRQDHYPLFRCEAVTLKTYSILAGFPVGTIFKVLVLVELEGGSAVGESAYWWCVFAGVVIGGLDVTHAVLWRNRKSIGSAVELILMLCMVYVAFSFTNFFRVAWPAASREADMNRGSYDYGAGVWVLVPAGNWAEAATPWWIVMGAMLAVVWSDALLLALPGRLYENDPFEGIRKGPVLLSATGCVATLALVLWHVDNEWTDAHKKPFEWWIALPIVIGELLTLTLIVVAWLYTVVHCPAIVWEREKLLAPPPASSASAGAEDEAPLDAASPGRVVSPADAVKNAQLAAAVANARMTTQPLPPPPEGGLQRSTSHFYPRTSPQQALPAWESRRGASAYGPPHPSASRYRDPKPHPAPVAAGGWQQDVWLPAGTQPPQYESTSSPAEQRPPRNPAWGFAPSSPSDGPVAPTRAAASSFHYGGRPAGVPVARGGPQSFHAGRGFQAAESTRYNPVFRETSEW